MRAPALSVGRAAAVAAILLWGCGPVGHEARTPADPKSPDSTAQTQGAPGASPRVSSLETGLQMYRRGDLKGAEPQLLAALKDAPGDRRILETLGAIYARSDRYRQAEESFRKALGIEPAALGARLGLAAVLIDTGRYDEAGEALAEVRRRDPTNRVALLKGALLDARLGRTAQAEAAARQVIAIQPTSVEAHYVLGLALEQKGELAEAAAEMRRVHELSATHRGALHHLVTIATRMGRENEAQQWRSLQLETLSRAHVEERVREHRINGVAAFNREDYKTALQEFQVIAREDPDDPQVHLHLGSTLMALGDLEGAKRELLRCLALDPRNDRALAELGRMHALANRLDDALVALGKAVAVNPEFAEPHYYLAGIYMARGEADRYREEMKIFNDLRTKSQGSALEVEPQGGP